MITIVESDELNSDWIKTLSWDLPTDLEGFLNFIGGFEKLDHFMELPAAQAMPNDLKVALSGLDLTKHLSGKHNQATHAGGRSGSIQSASFPVPDDEDISGGLVSASYPYVGLSSKAQAIAAQISPSRNPKTVETSESDGSREVTQTTEADYKTPDGDIYTIQYRHVTRYNAMGTETKSFGNSYVETQPSWQTPKADWIRPSMAFQTSPQGNYFIRAIRAGDATSVGIATALLEFARRETPAPIWHSSEKTKAGAEFAATTKSVEKAEESYKPTAGMKTAAERALRWKKAGKATGAGTPVGWGRATDIASGRSMSFDVVQRMFSFFSRHEVDKKGKDFDNLGNPSNGRIMWDAWGGDAGFGWSRNIVERHKRMEKHLQGQHNQASHGRKGNIKAGYDNWYGPLADLRLAGKELTKQGNASQMVIVEAAGFNGKPKMVELSELDPDKIMYRGVSNEDYKTDFLESEVQFGGVGVLGNGTYFTNNSDTAKNYAKKDEWDDKRMITAQWTADANVLNFENQDKAMIWLTNEQRIFKEGLGDFYQSDTSDFAGIGGQLSSYFVNGMNFTNMAIMKGYDGVEMNVKIGNKQENYTIVLNRGKLMVAK